MMRKNCCILFFIMSLAVLLSCKPNVPARYIQPDAMEDILYDYYLADAMANGGEGEYQESSYSNGLYKLAVLKKHGVSQADFDSSLVYYARHADRLHKIYENIEKRLGNAAVALGATAGDLQQFGSMVESTDTADIWEEERSFMLSTSMLSNVLSYSVKADTAFHKGDRIILSFDTHFIYQDGTKDGVAMLAMRLDNDSVVTRTVHMSSNSHYTLSISDDRNVGVKEVYGFIFLTKKQDTSSSTMKMMFVDNIKLVRLHNTISKDKTLNTMSGDTVTERGVPGTRRLEETSPAFVRMQDLRARPASVQ